MATLCGYEVKIKRKYGIESKIDLFNLDFGTSQLIAHGRKPFVLNLEVWLKAQNGKTTREILWDFLHDITQAQINKTIIALETGDSLSGDYYILGWKTKEERAAYTALDVNLLKKEM